MRGIVLLVVLGRLAGAEPRKPDPAVLEPGTWWWCASSNPKGMDPTRSMCERTRTACLFTDAARPCKKQRRAYFMTVPGSARAVVLRTRAECQAQRALIADGEATSDCAEVRRTFDRVTIVRNAALAETSLSPDAVLAKIESAYLSGIERCYREALFDAPWSRGKLELTFAVAGNGRAIPVAVKSFA